MSRLHFGAGRGLIEEVRAGISEGLDLNEAIEPGLCSPLYHACNKGYVKIVRLLLQAGADPNQRIKNGSSPVATAIDSQASDESKLEIIMLFAEHGGHVDWKGSAASAARTGKSVLWEAVLLAGADPEEHDRFSKLSARELFELGGLGAYGQQLFSNLPRNKPDEAAIRAQFMTKTEDPEQYILDNYKSMLYIGYNTSEWPDTPEKAFIDRLQEIFWSIDLLEELFKKRLTSDELIDAEKHIARMRRREKKYERRHKE